MKITKENILNCAFHPYDEDDEDWLNIIHYSKVFLDCENYNTGEFHPICEFTI